MALPNPIFEESYARIFGDGVSMGESADEFFQVFYDHFLKNPRAASLFARTNIARQVVMLKKSLFQLVSFYVVGEPTAELERLAMVHSRLKISADLFDVWMQALVDTVAQFDSDFDEETRLAWCWAFAPGIAYMRLMLNSSSVRAG